MAPLFRPFSPPAVTGFAAIAAVAAVAAISPDGNPDASSAPIIPDSTSPDPAVAAQDWRPD